MRVKTLAAGLLALVVGCATARQKSHDALEHYNPVTAENKLDSNGEEKPPYDVLPEHLEEFVKKAYIIDEKDFYDKKVKGYSNLQNLFMCISKGYTKATAYHEAAHLREEGRRRQGSDFTKRWLAVADFGYDKTKKIESDDCLLLMWDDNTDCPRYGCMSPYGGTSVHEDIAEYTAQAAGYDMTPKQLVHTLEVVRSVDEERIAKGETTREVADINHRGAIDAYAHLYPLYFCDPTDKKYKGKIDLLHEDKYVTDDEYALMLKELGTLYQLRKLNPNSSNLSQTRH